MQIGFGAKLQEEEEQNEVLYPERLVVNSFLEEQLKESSYPLDISTSMEIEYEEPVPEELQEKIDYEEPIQVDKELQEKIDYEGPIQIDKELQENNEFKFVNPVIHNHFVLDLFESKSFKDKNVLEEFTYKIVPKHPTEKIPMNHVILHLKALFTTLLEEMQQKYGDTAKVRVFIWHVALKKQIIIPPQFLDKVSSDILISEIEDHLYSAGELPIDENLQINLAVANLDLKGASRRKILSANHDPHFKTSVVQIQNSEDNLCLHRAIAVGLSNLDEIKPHGKKRIPFTYKQMKERRGSIQKRGAYSAITQAGIPHTKTQEDELIPLREGCIFDIPLYEKKFKVSIVVFSAQYNNSPVYPGNPYHEDKIFLYHSKIKERGHFDLITSPKGMMSTPYFCVHCLKGFSSAYKHSCKYWCSICGRPECIEGKRVKQCTDCNKLCRSADCYQLHKEKKTRGRGKNKGLILASLCEQFWECPECHVTLKRSERAISSHKCGEMKCNVCQQYHMDSNHLCYMRSIDSESKHDKFIFYDYECHQEDGIHRPNFVVAHSICSFCEHEPVTELAKCNNCGSRCPLCDSFNKKENEFEKNPCDTCGHRQVIFQGANTNTNFCEWLISPHHRDFTVIAHNARAYDAYFIYEYLM